MGNIAIRQMNKTTPAMVPVAIRAAFLFITQQVRNEHEPGKEDRADGEDFEWSHHFQSHQLFALSNQPDCVQTFMSRTFTVGECLSLGFVRAKKITSPATCNIWSVDQWCGIGDYVYALAPL